MAKFAAIVEKAAFPSTVKWNLKENDDGKLEWITEHKSGLISSDAKDKKKRVKGVEPRAVGGQSKRNDRAVSNMTGKHRTGGNMHGNRHTSPQRQKRRTRNKFVLLEDIKAVAYDQLSEISSIAPDFDKIIFKAAPFDDFLYQLILYFDCYFHKMDLEQKGKVSTSIEPGLSERKEFADSVAKVEVARKMLGRSYCHLVLGLGLEDAHHMGCGLRRVSDTKRDRHLYETLYSYCCFLVWITFKRKQFDVIKREMGSTLRSDTFNPAIRVKNAPARDEDERTDVNNPKKKMSPAEYRRIHPKRPAIKSIINQRSPAVVSILPSSREEAGYLFKHKRPPSPSSLFSSAADTISSDSALSRLIDELENLDIKSQRIGILNDSMDNYNAMSLQGGHETEGATEENTGEPGETGEDPTQTAPNDTLKPPEGSGPMSRVGTAISQATTDAPSEI